jgi:hypothetical protein
MVSTVTRCWFDHLNQKTKENNVGNFGIWLYSESQQWGVIMGKVRELLQGKLKNKYIVNTESQNQKKSSKYHYIYCQRFSSGNTLEDYNP